MSGERKEKIIARIQEAEFWVEFTRTEYWRKFKEMILNEIAAPARDAFHNEPIDELTNEKVLRHTFTQRATVKTCLNVIDKVESHVRLREVLQSDLDKIEKGGQKTGRSRSQI